MIHTFLFPSDYFNKNKVDPALYAEYDVCEKMNETIIIFSYKKWFENRIIDLTAIPTKNTVVIYRGWMMTPEVYKEFYAALKAYNITLINDPNTYNFMHIFPNVYKSIQEDTAKTLTFSLHQSIDLNRIKANGIHKFLVKDYVKSVKGSTFPSSFHVDMAQEEFDNWMKLFYQYRGNLLTGGICIKEFLNLKHYGDKTNEYRVYYANHKICSIAKNSNQDYLSPLPPEALILKYKNLPSNYYTIDYAQLEDDSWIIIECGDGQVSGLSNSQDYSEYYRNLILCFNQPF